MSSRRLYLFFALWLLLRVALALSGGGLGTGLALRYAGRESAAIFFRGAQPSKTLVVVTHGGLASKETMLPSCWQARELGADCVAVDLLGHGASAPARAANYYADARRALRVDREFGEYADVRFIGHSLGASVGCGGAFSCNQSVAIGQTTPCKGRTVWGDAHKRLGLPDSFYLPVSHLLEPWSPGVVARAVSLALPGRANDRSSGVALRTALAWASFALAAATGVYAARFVRARRFGGRWARGAAAALALWAAVYVGGFRTVWYLAPSQPSDWAIIGLTAAAASAIAASARLFGARRPGWGVVAAFACVEVVAWAVAALFPARELRPLLLLPPFLLAPVAAAVALAERLSRPRDGDPVEAAAFASLLVGACLALLVPATA